MNTFFYNSEPGSSAFPVDSFFDVLQGKIPAEKYRNKIVLIGATALGVGDTFVTPVDAAMSPVLTLAHSVSSILNEDFFIQPEWAFMARLGAVLLVARNGVIEFHEAYGWRNLFTRQVVTTDTVFDLASLTKPLATAVAVMLLVQRESDLLPGWAAFIGGIIESPDLVPNAARDNFQRNDPRLAIIRRELSRLIISYLTDLARTDPETFARINDAQVFSAPGFIC